jgi:hypothetical protein
MDIVSSKTKKNSLTTYERGPNIHNMKEPLAASVYESKQRSQRKQIHSVFQAKSEPHSQKSFTLQQKDADIARSALPAR